MASREQSNPILDRVARAIYESNVDQAFGAIEKVKFDSKDMVDVYKNVKSETDTGISIITAAYMDDVLNRLFRLHMDNIESNVVDDLFNVNGPLDSFSSRIRTAYAFGLIREETYNNLDHFRKIRNSFAHKPFGLISDLNR